MTKKQKQTNDFYKNKQINKIDYINLNNILVYKKNHTIQKIPLNTLLDIMIMVLLDHYA